MPSALLHRLRRHPSKFSVPEGIRVYAIGDVHGCVDQLEQLLDIIQDEAAATQLETHLVFLGDLVDRGPASSDVIGLLRTGPLPADVAHFIMGNHEEVMIECYEGESDRCAPWLQFGGAETLESYGLKRKDILAPGFDVRAAMRKVVPETHIAFIKSFTEMLRLGDYLFVHAGIRPGVSIDHQWSRDLRWIRREFISSALDHGCMVVHGHTIVPTVECHSNRIAVDTGCYATGRLSAVVLEGDKVRVICAES